MQDYERGGGGGDTFVYNPGYGHLEVSENDFSGGTDIVQIGGTLTASQVLITGDNNNNIYITDGTSGDQVELDGEINNASYYGVQSIQFSDGTSLTKAQMVALASVKTGTTGADALSGSGEADTFDGKGAPVGGQDYERGGGGGDTFVYNPGYGHLEVSENDFSGGTDIVHIGGGLTASQALVTSDSNSNIYITDGTSGDQVELDGEINNASYYGVQSVQFDDGTSLTKAQMVTLSDTASINNQTLYGTGSGADTFYFTADAGSVEIHEVDYHGNHSNILMFGGNVIASQLLANADNAGNVFLTVSGGNYNIKLDQQIVSGGNYGVDKIQFSDGSSFSRQEIASLIQHQ